MSTKYQIWLSFNAETEKIHFPVNPEEIQMNCNGKFDSIDIAGLGEILIQKNRPAIEISWSSFLPAAYFPGMNFREIYDPYWVSSRINSWKTRTGPCHLIITNTPIDMYVLVSKYTLKEKGGDVGTVYYDISLKEYREVTVRQVSVDLSSGEAVVEPNATRVDNTVIPQTYTVQAGDEMYNIARKFLGDGGRYMEIYNLNKDVIGSIPTWIFPGMVLKLPG